MTSQTDCVSEELSEDLSELQGSRINALSASRDLQTIMQSFLQHEARRIEQKLGRQHPRSQRLSVVLKANLDLINTLEVERQVMQVKVPDVAEDAALVHGRVVDEDGRGISDLVVCLVDGRTTPVETVEDSTTEKTGYFAITLDPKLTERVVGKHKKGVFLAVFTNRCSLVHREPKPLPLAKSTRLLHEVNLSRNDLVAGQPPKPRSKPRMVRLPDVTRKPESDAVEILLAAKLTVDDRKTTPTPDQDGRVLTQNPKAGNEVALGTAVSLVIGVADQVQVPSVMGMKVEEANAKIQESRLKIGSVTERPHRSVGIVLKQIPEADQEVLVGTAVNLVVGRQRSRGIRR